MDIDFQTFKCPYPFVVPKPNENDKNNHQLTLANCTDTIAHVLDPVIAVYQIVFVSLWLFIVAVHFVTFKRLWSAHNLSTIEYYRYSVAKIGIIQGALIIVYWVCHDTRGYWYYQINNYLDEFAAFFLFWLALNLVEFWGALAKIRVKLSVTRHGIPNYEKKTFLVLMGINSFVLSGLEYFGPIETCRTYSALKFLISAIIVLLMGLRAALFVYKIDVGIREMKGSKDKSSIDKRSLVWQLRIKFFLFFCMVLGFSAFGIDRANKKFKSTWKCEPLLINRLYQYEVPIPQLLYLLAGYVMIFQFAKISICISGNSKSKSKSKSATDPIISPPMPDTKVSEMGSAASFIIVHTPKRTPSSIIASDDIDPSDLKQ